MSAPEHQPRVVLTFLLPSLVGLGLFLTPVPFGDGVSIPIAILAKAVVAALGAHSTPVITVIVLLSALGALLTKALRPRWVSQRPFVDALLNVSPFWLVVRVLGGVFCLLCYCAVGPAAIRSADTGGLLLNELMPLLLSIFLLAGLMLPLLLDFGLLELAGSLMTPVMRPLFRLPGRSAIDCAASWLGDGSVGILLTCKQYEGKFYTQREAAIIATNFSAVSITFCLVVIAQVRLEHLFWQFYLTVCVAGFVAALIVPKLPPLSRKADLFIDQSARTNDAAAVPAGHNALSWGLNQALARAKAAGSVTRVLGRGLRNAVDMIVGVLPVVMAIGTLALMVAEYTPLFQLLGKPFVPLLELLRVPEAGAVSQTVLVGFADMFIPSIMASTIESELARFCVATLSVTQLIYMSEVGALLLGSHLPITFVELVVVFLLRTLVTLPVVVLLGHWLV